MKDLRSRQYKEILTKYILCLPKFIYNIFEIPDIEGIEDFQRKREEIGKRRANSMLVLDMGYQ